MSDLTRRDVVKLIALASDKLILCGVNLHAVDLSSLGFREANLTNAKLSGAIGLRKKNNWNT